MNNSIEFTVDKWTYRFLDLAKEVSTWSKDPSTKVGAVIVDHKQRVISTGFNGFPQKIEDKEEDYLNREVKMKKIIHGEINALIFAQRSIEGCTLFTYPFAPCHSCSSIFIQAGITKVIAPNYEPERWKESFTLSKELFKEARVKLELIDYA